MKSNETRQVVGMTTRLGSLIVYRAIQGVNTLMTLFFWGGI